MAEKILRIIKKIIPKPVFNLIQPAYHFAIAYFSALFYGFPSRKMFVIGVTGTKGKTTTCDLISQILEKSGFKTGMATTVNFRIGEKQWINETKQTMLGRFQLQKLLRRMVREKCEYAVIETSSEGIIQYRHRFVDYSMAIFTNLSAEHIERHGSFEKYREAKVKLFEKVAKKKNGIGIYNLDDKNVKYFLRPDIKHKYGYTLKSNPYVLVKGNEKTDVVLTVQDVKLNSDKSEFTIAGEKFIMPLIGEFNIYNATAAIGAGLSQGISINKIKNALAEAKSPAGRLEVVDEGQDFTVIIDYAHEPMSLEAAYRTLVELKIESGNKNNSKLICVLGSQGGGRDKWKRKEMGKIAAKYCNEIILTNEDPYDEDPNQILNDIKLGIETSGFSPQNPQLIIDRKEAISNAMALAKKDDVVILTGKAGEVWMCVENGKRIRWDERKIAEEAIANQSRI